jgi:hypothetical protein
VKILNQIFRKMGYGVIEAKEVEEIARILNRNDSISEKDAIWLFELNDEVSGRPNDDSWETLFTDSITSYLLDNENSIGEINLRKAQWLYDNLNIEVMNDIEKKLLLNLKRKANSFPSNLESLLN